MRESVWQLGAGDVVRGEVPRGGFSGQKCDFSAGGQGVGKRRGWKRVGS